MQLSNYTHFVLTLFSLLTPFSSEHLFWLSHFPFLPFPLFFPFRVVFPFTFAMLKVFYSSLPFVSCVLLTLRLFTASLFFVLPLPCCRFFPWSSYSNFAIASSLSSDLSPLTSLPNALPLTSNPPLLHHKSVFLASSSPLSSYSIPLRPSIQ